MEVAQEEKRLRPNSYGPSPTIQHHRMQASDSASHNYQPPSGSASNYGAGPAGWAPPPSPFANEPRQSSEVSQHSNSYPPPSRENTYAAEVPYDSRPGSISAQPRSPGDGTVQLLHHVNGSPPDGQYQSHQIPPDFRNRGGYIPPDAPPNGNHAAGLHIATSQEVMTGHPPFPHTPHGPYSHPQSAGPGPGPGPSPVYETYYTGPHWNNPAVSRDRPKKPVRAQQACDSCRTRKAKCDEARPCSHCKDNSLSCTYRDVPPHKQDRNALALEAKIDSLQREMVSMQREMSSIQRETCDKLNQMLRMCERVGERMSVEKLPPNSATVQGTATWQSSQALSNAQHGAMMTTSSKPVNHVNSVDAVSLPNPVEAVNVDSEEMNSLPHSHTTAAQNLLLWPSIKEFGLESDPDYVMNEEESRGLLRLYGRGEGHDKMDTGRLPASPAAESGSSVQADDSPSPPAESLWGYGFRPPNPSQYGNHGDNPGGLNANGTPTYEPELVDKYFDSYMRHIYILHPFLDKKAMRDLINCFKSRYSRDRQGLVRKRKREGDDSPNFGHEPQRSSLGSHNIGVERSVRNAMVLLVLALGMICEHKAPLPASPPASSMATVTTSAPTPRSSNSDPFSPIPASPHQQMGARSRAWAANIPERHESEKTNVDVIPGLAYYNVACDILGGLRGGYDLSHVQAALLAGLYMGQIAQVHASHDWITQAGKACQVLINP
jgi:Fungal Zn(2)-Cys(6) binuclear cluster domain